MDKTWRPTTAGILTIISGCYGIGIGVTMVRGASFLNQLVGSIVIGGVPPDIGRVGSLIGALGIAGIVLGVIALIGGIFARRRRHWGFALTGALVSLPLVPVGTVLGILSIVFLSEGKREFI